MPELKLPALTAALTAALGYEAHSDLAFDLPALFA